MATTHAGDKVIVSVKNTFLDFAYSDASGESGESGTLRRCSSDGELSCRSISKSSDSSCKTQTYMWLPSSNASTEDVMESMSRSSFASCSKTHRQTHRCWRTSNKVSSEDITDTMSQASFTSCDSSSVFSAASIWSAPGVPWETQDVAYTNILVDTSCVKDAPLPPCSHLVTALHKETGIEVQDLQNLESEGILEQIPRNDQGEIASVGSLQHHRGSCTPCIFWFRGICTKSLKCGYCHFRHPGQKAKRHKPNKRTRQVLRDIRLKQTEEDAMSAASEEA